jgi:4-aminobutyrate aminotransferase-like enzyme
MTVANTELLERRYRYLGRHSPLFYENPLHIVRGEGVWLWDADGNRYLDAYNNVPHVGHCHPRVVEALKSQASTLNTHTRYLHDNIVDYVERLTGTFDESLAMAMIACTGSEANEIALRMARQHTGGEGIIVSNDTYHGNTAAVFELATTFQAADAPLAPRIRSIPPPDSYRALHNLDGEALADAYTDEVQAAIDSFDEAGIKLAGIILCPEFANEGLLDVPEGYMHKAISKVRAAGGLFIADEVQGGFGRTGNHMWGHQWFEGLVPDIVTLGKPMGNGHPISGVVARADLIDEFGASGMYFNTFGGNPVSCAVAMAVLQVLEEEELLQNAVSVGGYVGNGLRELQKKYDLIGDVRQKGMFFAVDMTRDHETREPADTEAKQIVEGMLARNILMSRIGRRGCILKMRPPMPFDRDHADLLLSTLDDCFAAL